MILAASVSIRDPIVRVSFHNKSHSYRLLLRSLFRYKSILSLPLAQLLLFESEYNGSHPFTLKLHKQSPQETSCYLTLLILYLNNTRYTVYLSDRKEARKRREGEKTAKERKAK